MFHEIGFNKAHEIGFNISHAPPSIFICPIFRRTPSKAHEIGFNISDVPPSTVQKKCLNPSMISMQT